MSHLMLYLLGAPRLELDGESLHISRRKVVALLAYLATENGSHSRDALATLLWPKQDQSTARAYLRRALSELNRALGGEFLAIDRETVGLHPGADLWLDVNKFRGYLAACETHGHPIAEVCPDCVPLLEEATELYRDDFMAGFTLRDSPAFDEWQFFQSEGLRDELAGTLERLVRRHGSQGEYEAAIPYARRWLALDPLHEPAHRHLMQLYAQAGQRAAALRQYQECMRLLQAELDLPPSAETTSLHEQIRSRPADGREPFFATPMPRHNLPVQTTPFIGRDDELAEIEARLNEPDCRLLTLIGPGGSGKTRLALEVAAAQLDDHADGVFFVSLAPLRSAEAIVPTVAEALGFRFYASSSAEVEPQRQLLDYLRQKRMLLILDNLEHLLFSSSSPSGGETGDGAELVTEILKTAQDVKILATSRVRLNAGGECRFQIAGMDYPALDAKTPLTPGELANATLRTQDVAQYSAVKLFTQAARRAHPGFELTDENLVGVVQVCRLVQGMPLALRLAAAWVELLTPAEIAAEIGRNLDFLATDVRDVPDRQRSVRAVFDHSWNLLTEQEREVLQALSVFNGGFTRAAAREVAGASLRELRALVSKSLLHRAPTGRYEIHELLRQYAAEKLARTTAAGAAVRDRHCAYYAAALQGWETDLKGRRQVAALTEMNVEIENARVAWDWAVERHKIEHLDQAMDGLCRFYEWRGRNQEGETACALLTEWLSPMVMDALSADTTSVAQALPVLARCMVWQGVFYTRIGQRKKAAQLFSQGLDLLAKLELARKDTRAERAFALWQLGDVVRVTDTVQRAQGPLEQSLALYRALGDRWGMARVLMLLAGVELELGAPDKAKPLADQSVALHRSLGDHQGTARSLVLLGLINGGPGQKEKGESLLRESVSISRQIGDSQLPLGLLNLGGMVSGLGRFQEAHALLEESLALFTDQGSLVYVAMSTHLLGGVELAMGRYEQARSRAQASLALAREINAERVVAGALDLLGRVALVQGAYAEAQAALQTCATMRRAQGLKGREAGALCDLAVATCGLGQMPQARQTLSQALRIATEMRQRGPLVSCVAAAARLCADQGEAERAIELYALASRHPYVANSRASKDVLGKRIAAMAASLPADAVAAAQKRGRARDLRATAEELLAELS